MTAARVPKFKAIEPKPPIPEPPARSVITFSKSFGEIYAKRRTYTYAAIRIGKRWYLTGSATGCDLNWLELLAFIGDGERDGLGLRTVLVATGWVQVE